MAKGMARAAADDDDGLIKEKDFKKAAKIYYGDILPATSKASEYMQEVSTGFKAIKRECGVQSMVAKFVFKLLESEESKQEDALRCLKGLLTEFRLFLPSDLVDAAEGTAGSDVVPSEPPAAKTRAKPKLVTIPAHPADDSDLAGDDF